MVLDLFLSALENEELENLPTLPKAKVVAEVH